MIRLALCLLALVSSPVMAEQIVVQGALPQGKGWQIVGSLPIEVVEVDGRSAIELNDQSETDHCGLRYTPSDEQSQIMLQKGFVLEVNIKQLISGTHGLTVRMKGAAPITVSLWRNERSKQLSITMYDLRTKKHLGGSVDADRFVLLSIAFAPGSVENGLGTATLSADGKELRSIAVLASQDPRQSAVEIGGGPAPRKGHTFVESVRLTIGPASPDANAP